jgi:hypothetical protein
MINFAKKYNIMEAKLIKKEGRKVTYEITLDMEGSMLEMEDQIQAAVNELGMKATHEALNSFDTNGSPLTIGGVKYTSKGRSKKKSKRPTDK